MKKGKARKKAAKKKKNKLKPQKQNIKNTAPEKKPRSTHSNNKVLLSTICIILLFATILGLNWLLTSNNPQSTQPQTQTENNTPKVAIIDGLYNNYPNIELTQNLEKYITDAGYKVDLYQGTNVTINLLQNIKGYQMLILRLHSVISEDGQLFIFSGEKYNETSYVNEQLQFEVRRGVTFIGNETPVFALNAEFLGENNPNSLNNTTIILAGCNGTATTQVTQTLFERGVKAYVSWNGYVDLSHSDRATLQLAKALFTEQLSIETAIKKVMTEVGPDPSYNSEITYQIPQPTQTP